MVEIASAGISAGAKQVSLRASYRHQPGNFTSGRLRFDTSSNALPLAQFETVHKQRPDLTGTAQFDAAGLVDVSPSNNGQPAFRVISLSGHATAGAVAVNGQQLGDLDVRAGTAKGVLTAYLTSNFAGSAVRGDGTFKLEDDYSGTARVTFSRLDFVRLRQFFSEPAVTRVRVAGSMSGDVTLSGPIAIPERWKAGINIAELQLGPARDITVPGKAADFTLHNAGPITATMANGVLKVERARFVGRATDLTLAGSVAVQKANALDLRLKGRVDLATLQDLDRDITASGFLNTDATIRGRFDDPQVNGRLEVKDAAFQPGRLPQRHLQRQRRAGVHRHARQHSEPYRRKRRRQGAGGRLRRVRGPTSSFSASSCAPNRCGCATRKA